MKTDSWEKEWDKKFPLGFMKPDYGEKNFIRSLLSTQRKALLKEIRKWVKEHTFEGYFNPDSESWYKSVHLNDLLSFIDSLERKI